MYDGVNCINCGGWMLRIHSDDECMTCDTCEVEMLDGRWGYNYEGTFLVIPEDVQNDMRRGDCLESADFERLGAYLLKKESEKKEGRLRKVINFLKTRKIKLRKDKITGANFTLFAVYANWEWYPPSVQLYLFNHRLEVNFVLK